MKMVETFKALGDQESPIILALGFFDGVHIGHQAVIRTARALAEQYRGEAWALTLEPHPLKLIAPAHAPEIITCKRHKLRLLEARQLDGCILLPFDETLRHMEPETFVESLCEQVPAIKHLVTGVNWTFGKDGRGDISMLAQLSAPRGIQTSIVAPVSWNDLPVSSTRIREAVSGGDLESAEAMLGRPFSLLGHVVHGRRIGHTLGFPTANIDPHNEVHPPAGIYAVHAIMDGTSYKAAAYIGTRPTFEDANERVVEVYMLDLPDIDLYGKEIEVFFKAKVREDRRFMSPEELSLQIQQDIATTRAILA
ncbi:MAG: bifunctional riboflavin kinase/FAD synthetase [Spartobacteria bacterium]|nr:bifunctional riboflavin kinase/FAD synthetase [Spartobacteria bacterium]